MNRALASVLLVWAVGSSVAAREIPEIAYDIMHKDMSDSEWKKFVRKTTDHYESWINDNPSGSLKRFLDDKLMPIAMGVPKGEIKTLKKFVYWLALYKEFREPPPWYIREVADKHKQDLDDLLTDFSWERASNLVKKKANEYTPEEKRKLGERMHREK